MNQGLGGGTGFENMSFTCYRCDRANATHLGGYCANAFSSAAALKISACKRVWITFFSNFVSQAFQQLVFCWTGCKEQFYVCVFQATPEIRIATPAAHYPRNILCFFSSIQANFWDFPFKFCTVLSIQYFVHTCLFLLLSLYTVNVFVNVHGLHVNVQDVGSYFLFFFVHFKTSHHLLLQLFWRCWCNAVLLWSSRNVLLWLWNFQPTFHRYGCDKKMTEFSVFDYLII